MGKVVVEASLDTGCIDDYAIGPNSSASWSEVADRERETIAGGKDEMPRFR